jgi:ABC-type transport system involved in multi-copper enzyme maturation permease subunit
VVHPFWALQVALNQIHPPLPASVADYTWPLNHMLARPQSAYMAITLLASVVLVTLATILVRSGTKQGELSWLRKRFERLWRKPAGERTRRVRRVWSNPVAWREAVTRASAASSNLMRYSYLGFGVLASVYFLWCYAGGKFPTTNAARDWLTWTVMIEFFVVLLMAANTAATAITRERDEGTMELLLVTPLTSQYLIWGKLRGLVSFAVPLMTIPAATVIAVAIYDLAQGSKTPVVSPVQAIVLPVQLSTYAAIVCMIGLQMSLKSRGSVQAVIASIGILIVAGFGLGLCAVGATKATAEIGTLMAPLTFVTAVFFTLDPENFIGNMSSRSSIGRMDIEAFLLIGTVLAAVLYGAIVAGAYRSMIAKFDMIIRKQSK